MIYSSVKPPKTKNVYPMTKTIRGHCLIINVDKFTNHIFQNRRGSQIDVENTGQLFKQLGFKVHLKTDLTKVQFLQELNRFSELKDHKQSQICVVVLMSHGNEEGLFTSDGFLIEKESILKKFHNQNCPNLMGKPKFFIFQACQGDVIDIGVTNGATEADNVVKKRPQNFLPTWEDMLILSASIRNYKSFRNTKRGSWLIECLTYVFMNYSCQLDILELLAEVSKGLRSFYQTDEGWKQTCSYELRGFYHKLYFNPGHFERQ